MTGSQGRSGLGGEVLPSLAGEGVRGLAWRVGEVSMLREHR